MGAIYRLNQNEVTMAEKFLEKVKSGEVTHGVICYRNQDGDINYQIYSPEHLTYVLGMMERVKGAMINQ